MINSDSLLDEFSEDCRLRRLSEKTNKEYRQIVKTFLTYNGEISSFDDVDNGYLKSFLAYLLDERELRHKTVKSYFLINIRLNLV